MTVSRFADHLLSGVHGDRPAAGDVAEATLYGCDTHHVVYQANSGSWDVWFDPTATGGASISALVDAAGDLLVGSGPDTLVRLPKGTDLKVLTVVAGDVVWATPASGLDLEGVRDMLATALVAGAGIDIDVDDPGDTLTISLTGDGGNANLLRENAGTYPTREHAGEIAVFVGPTDPGPDGLDVMEAGDYWITDGDTALADHLADTTDAHDASAISFVPHSTLAATNVQAAIEELLDEIGAVHVPFTPYGTIAATNVQAAIQELLDEAGGGGGATELLASLAYNPVADAAVNSTSATVADLDATNLAIPFTVPASGKVLITLSALATTPGTNVANSLNWHLRESTTTIDTKFVCSAATQINMWATVHFKITGLTPAASKTYKWAHSRSGSGGTGVTHYGGAIGAAVMAVWAAA